MPSRRQFLQQSALLSLSPWIPAFLPRSLSAAEAKRDDRILVVIQLDGGNDGLNTVIPYADENYAKHRKELFVRPGGVLKLNDAIGLHPAMKPTMELFEDGRLTIVQGVGYPNPNRSHFQSMSNWQHARLDENQHDSIGWLGRAADTRYAVNNSSPDAIYVGEEATPVAIRGRRSNAISFASEADLKLLQPAAAPVPIGAGADDLSAFVARTIDQSYDAARQFSESQPAATNGAAPLRGSALGRKLGLIARLIQLNGGTRLYYVSQTGYDTHSSQAFQHQRLLSDFSNALRGFLNVLRDSKHEDQVVVLAFSEFGRRVQENGSAGTDHGAAAPVILAGKPLTGGIIGDHPSLEDLDAGDLRMSTDFRSIYATLLTDWLNIDPIPVLGAPFEPMPLFAG